MPPPGAYNAQSVCLFRQRLPLRRLQAWLPWLPPTAPGPPHRLTFRAGSIERTTRSMSQIWSTGEPTRHVCRYGCRQQRQPRPVGSLSVRCRLQWRWPIKPLAHGRRHGGVGEGVYCLYAVGQPRRRLELQAPVEMIDQNHALPFARPRDEHSSPKADGSF